jgi:hypothetical protein
MRHAVRWSARRLTIGSTSGKAGPRVTNDGGVRLARTRTTLRVVAAFVALITFAGAATVVANAAGSHPLPDKRPPGWIAIEKVSDGCGQEGSLFRAHDQTYETDKGQKVNVDFNEACNLHDAAYSGALVWDSINGSFIDYSEPRWTKAAINEKFKHDLQRLCFRAFPDAAGTGAENALLTCLTSNDVRKFGTWGALSFYDIVNSLFGASPRERIDLTSNWKNTAVGFPLCDIAGNDPMTIKQNGREVTAEWQNGTGSQYGHFRGTLITGGNEGEDVVVGEFTILDAQAGAKVSGGAMTFNVTSADTIDFNGTGIGGTMVRVGRSTQGVGLSTAFPRCRVPKTPVVTIPTTAPGTFVLASTKVSNPNAPELTIDAAGGTALWDHTGQYGGAGKGGEWKVMYTWKVPQTLVAGKSSSISLSLTANSVQPVQPLLVQMGARAPDFVQALSINYPNPASASKTYTVPLAADQKDSKDVVIIVSVVSAEITYTYHRSGA